MIVTTGRFDPVSAAPVDTDRVQEASSTARSASMTAWPERAARPNRKRITAFPPESVKMIISAVNDYCPLRSQCPTME